MKKFRTKFKCKGWVNLVCTIDFSYLFYTNTVVKRDQLTLKSSMSRHIAKSKDFIGTTSSAEILGKKISIKKSVKKIVGTTTI